jgi:hypothetical protein
VIEVGTGTLKLEISDPRKRRTSDAADEPETRQV